MKAESLIESIRSNTLEELVLSRGGAVFRSPRKDEFVCSLVDAIACNTSIKSAVLSDFVMGRDSFIGILKAVSKLPNLEKLGLYASHNVVIPVHIIVDILSAATVGSGKQAPASELKRQQLSLSPCSRSSASKLKHLNVINGLGFRSQDEIDALSHALKNHPTLIEVGLLDLDCVSDREDSNSNDKEEEQDNMIGHNSEHRPSHRQQHHHAVVVAKRQAQRLSLDPLFHALSTINNLETVDITLSTRFMSNMKRLSNSCITGLFGRGDRRNDNNSKSNNSSSNLLDVSLWHVRLDDGHLRAALPAIQSHPTLKFLSLRSNPNITQNAWRSDFLKMLEHNYVLVSVYTDMACSKFDKQLSTLLKLNQIGRGTLMQDGIEAGVSDDDAPATTTSRDDWIGFLDRISHDVDSVYYLLRTDPVKVLFAVD